MLSPEITDMVSIPYIDRKNGMSGTKKKPAHIVSRDACGLFRPALQISGFSAGKCQILERGKKCDQAKKDSQHVGQYERPLFRLDHQTVNRPDHTVNAGAKRLDPGAFYAMHIIEDLRNVGNIHENRKKASHIAKNFDLFLRHFFWRPVPVLETGSSPFPF